MKNEGGLMLSLKQMTHRRALGSLFAMVVSLFLAACSAPPESKTSDKGGGLGGGLNLTDVLVINSRMVGYSDFSTCVQHYYRRTDGTEIPGFPFLGDGSEGLMSASEGLIVVRRKVEIQPGQLGEYTKYPGEYIQGPSGYVNLAGQQVIPFQYKWAYDFSQGRAAVRVEAGYGLIDTAGNWFVPPGKYVCLGSYSDGRAPFQKEGELYSDDAKWGFLDLNGKEAIPPRFKNAKGWGPDAPVFRGGLAVVKDENDRTIAIDVNGNTQFAFPDKTVEAHPFSDGLALFRTGSRSIFGTDGGGLLGKTNMDYVDLLFM